MQKTITRWGVKLSFLLFLGLVAPSTAHAQFGLGKLLNKVTDALDKVGDALGVEKETQKTQSSTANQSEPFEYKEIIHFSSKPEVYYQ